MSTDGLTAEVVEASVHGLSGMPDVLVQPIVSEDARSDAAHEERLEVLPNLRGCGGGELSETHAVNSTLRRTAAILPRCFGRTKLSACNGDAA